MRNDKGSGMEFLASWPEWLIWCALGAVSVLAVATVVYVVEAAIDAGAR